MALHLLSVPFTQVTVSQICHMPLCFVPLCQSSGNAGCVGRADGAA